MNVYLEEKTKAGLYIKFHKENTKLFMQNQ